MLKTWRTGTPRFPKYINMLFFLVGVIAISYKQTVGANRLTGPLRSGLVGLWPIRGCILVRGGQVMRQLPERGGGSQYHESRVPHSSKDTTLLGSSHSRTVRPWLGYNWTSELCHHWRRDNRLRIKKKRQTNIYNHSCLLIDYPPTNSLAALMWRWYLNSKQAAGSSRRC